MGAVSHIDDMIHLCKQPVVYCTNEECARRRLDGDAPNGIPVNLAEVDPDWTVERFEAALRCSVCGKRSVQVKWLQYDQPTVYWTEARDKARAERKRSLGIPREPKPTRRILKLVRD